MRVDPAKRRAVTKRFRTTARAADAMEELASRVGLTFSEWVRQTLAAEVKANRLLPRDRWCSACGMRPLDCKLIRPECERCNRLQQELRQ